MPRPDHAAMGEWANEAIRQTKGASAALMCNIVTAKGRSQEPAEITEVAARIFLQAMDDLCGSDLHVRYSTKGKGMPARLKPIFQQTTSEPKEWLSMDFSAIEEPGADRPWKTRVVLECEPKPRSSRPTSTKFPFDDLNKLCSIDAEYGLYICRINSGNENIDGRMRPKFERYSNALKNALFLMAQRGVLAAAWCFVTAPRLPWVMYTYETIKDDKTGSVTVEHARWCAESDEGDFVQQCSS